MQDGPLRTVQVKAAETYAGQADGVGTKGRARGKYAPARVAAKPGWAHRGLPTLPQVAGDEPYEPDMRAALYAAQGIRIAELRRENYVGLQLRDHTALARDTEFAVKVAAYVRYGAHCVFVRHKASLLGKIIASLRQKLNRLGRAIDIFACRAIMYATFKWRCAL